MLEARTVCIIDDDTIFHTILKVKISKKELANKFLTFSDGDLAIDYFQKEENWSIDKIPDIIFLDINMPVMDGWQFLDSFSEIIPKLPKKIKIFMLSSSIDDRDMERARTMSVISEYITKPISDESLKNIFWEAKN